MRATGALRTGVAPGGALVGPWAQNELWQRARAVPSLDLRFADNKSLVDATTGQNLVTFSRASSGTYVDSTGTIRTATTNLFLNSEALGSWGSVTRASVSSNTIAAPNSQITADTLVEDNTASNTHEIINTVGVSFVSGLAYTFSVYAKIKERSQVTMFLPGAAFGSGTAQEVLFNLSNATTSTLTGSPTSSSIVAVGDGWYRCSVTASASTTATGFPRFRLAAGGTNSYTGDGTSGIYLWGAQLEQSSTVGEYIPTTSTINSAPRFDHDPTTGESLGLLVEEQRTNLLTYSEDFSNAAWTTSATTVTTNATTAPDGTTTADQVLETATTQVHAIYTTSLNTFTTGTVSFYVKANGRTNVALRFYHTTSNWVVTVFALTGSGSITQTSAGTSSNFSAVSRSIVNVGNGWYRISMTATQPSQSTFAGVVDIYSSPTPSLSAAVGTEAYAGDITKGIYIWGAQFETGAFPTSYIPTTTAAATRSADVASITGTAFSSWYRQDEGTVFADFNGTNIASGQFPRIFEFNDGTSNNLIRVQQYGANSVRASVSVANVNQFAADNGSVAVGVRGKTAFCSALNDAALVTNGASPTVDTTYLVPSGLTQLGIGGPPGASTSVFNSTIRRLTYWPQRLANNVLQTLTQ